MIFSDTLFLGFENESFCEKDKRQKLKILILDNENQCEYIWWVYKDIIFYKAKFSSSSDH